MQSLLRRALAVSAVMMCLLSAGRADWPQWGGSSSRNNVANVRNLPTEWNPGEFGRRDNVWDRSKAKNIKWVANLGSQTYGTPVVADGRIFVGTNNSNSYLKHYPTDVDLGCLLCFREQDGEFLWQFSAEKLPTGRVHDWPQQGIVSSPLVEGDRAWFVSNRGEVICLDTQGFHDNEDDGPVVAEFIPIVTTPKYLSLVTENPSLLPPLVSSLDHRIFPADLRTEFQKAGEELPAEIKLRIEEPGLRWSFTADVAHTQRDFMVRLEGTLRAYRRQKVEDKREADVVWRFNMMERLGSRQHNLATCCITSWKDTLFVCTSNGVDESHTSVQAPQAPSFFAMHKHTGEVLWTSNLPSANTQHGQWSAPAVGVLGGVPQVVFCGGDGWVYSFHAEQWHDLHPQLLWKFDTNAKDAILELGGRGTRNEPIAIPVLHDNKVFVTTGQDPEHGEGDGCIWCIDATRKLDGSDVSPQKVIDRQGNVIPPRRVKNHFTWQERQVYLSKNADRELDQDKASDYLYYYVTNGMKPGPLATVLTVKTVAPGAPWELTLGQGDAQEKMYLSKRMIVNHAGEREEVYFLARPTGERIIDNPDSAVVWKYAQYDRNGNGKLEFEEQMHRSISSVVISGELLFCPDFSGLFHCLDVKTGKPHWTCDLLAACWGTPLIADDRLFVGDEDGDVNVFQLSADPLKAGAVAKPDNKGQIDPNSLQPHLEINMGNSVYCNPVAANGVLYLTNKDHLFAIQSDATK